MLISDMHRRIKIGLDKVESLALPSFEPEELDEVLNIIQERIIKRRLFRQDKEKYVFEETEKRAKELGNLIKPANITIFTTDAYSKPLGKYVALPEDCWFVIQEELQVTGTTSCDNKIINDIRVWSHDDYNMLINDPFNRPDRDNIARLTYQTSHELLIDPSLTPVSYKIRYIKRPAQMSITTSTNCELKETIHQEIVDEVVSYLLENIESQRYQTNLNELNKSE